MSSPYIKPFRARSEKQNFGKSMHLSLSLANLEGNPAVYHTTVLLDLWSSQLLCSQQWWNGICARVLTAATQRKHASCRPAGFDSRLTVWALTQHYLAHETWLYHTVGDAQAAGSLQVTATLLRLSALLTQLTLYSCFLTTASFPIFCYWNKLFLYNSEMFTPKLFSKEYDFQSKSEFMRPINS